MKNKAHTNNDFHRMARNAYKNKPELINSDRNTIIKEIKAYILRIIGKQESELVPHQRRWLNAGVMAQVNEIEKFKKLGWYYENGHLKQSA